MPEQINQTLGFNATQAIKTLRELDGIMASFHKNVGNTVRALGGFNTKGGKAVGMLKKMKTAASGAATQMNRVYKAAEKGIGLAGVGTVAKDLDKISAAATAAGTAVANSAKKGKKGAKSWLLSWETIGRVVFTQAIVRGLNIVRQSLKAAIRDAVDFQKAIAEIETIGREMGGFENISNVVRRISDEFNVELGDTAEAVYQVISNQIAQSAEAVEQFTGSAAKFSKITKTDLATSVNLLSGTLNAFGKTVAETEEVAAKFFKTIELGRTRAEELAQGYGTVAPTAEKLGIAFEEVNAALATLTIQGIQTDKAFTQIRGLMVSFLKPTTDMTAAMRELGFATGEQLLEAYDLQEALRAVVGTTDGTAESVAKLIPRIRGLTGGLGLVGDEAEHFTKTIREQETALEDVYDKAYEIVITTDAERITKELNRVKNFFTDEFGEAVLKSAIDMSELLGGAEDLLLVFESMAKVIPALVASLVAVGTGMAVVKVQAWLAAGGLSAATTAAGALGIALGGIGLAAVAITAIIVAFKKVEQARAKEVADALAANNEKLASVEKRIAKELRAEKAKFAEMKKLHAQEMTEFRKVYLEEVALIEKENDSMVANTKWALDTILDARRTAVEAIGKASAGLSKSIEASRTSVRGMKSDLDALLFQRKVGEVGGWQQYELLTTEAAQKSAEAVKLMSKATTEEEHKAALAVHKHAMALNEQAFASDYATESSVIRNKVNSQARAINNDMIKATEKYQGRLKDEGKQLAINAREAASMMASWDAQKKKILELASVYDKEGQPLSADQVKANRIQMEKEITTLLTSIAKDSEKLGLEGTELTKKYFENLALDMDSVEVQTLLAAPDNMREVYAKVDASLQKLAKANPIRLEIELYAKMMDMPLGSLAEMGAVEKALGNTVERAEEMRKAFELTNAQIEIAKKNATEMGARMELATPTVIAGQHGVRTTIPLTETQKAYNAIVIEMREMAVSGHVNIDLLNALVDQATILRNSLGWMEEDPFSKNAVAFQAMANAMGDMANLQAVSERDNLLIADTDEAVKFRNLLRELLPLTAERNRKTAEGAAKVQEGTTAQTAQTAAVLTTNNAVETTISSYQRMTNAIRQAASAQSAMASSTKPAGKNVITNPYFAAGGTARGTDVVPAMLSAGERVTDAKNSRRFFSQLQAIGAGQQPVYRNAGGDTYNTNVGDINVQDTSGRPNQTAREVMRQIQREQRRGSGRI